MAEEQVGLRLAIPEAGNYYDYCCCYCYCYYYYYDDDDYY